MKEIEGVLTVQLTSVVQVSDRSADVIEKKWDEKLSRFLEALKQEHSLDNVQLIDQKISVKSLDENQNMETASQGKQ